MNLSTNQKLTGIENRFAVAKVERGGSGTGWELAIGRCKLLHLECINHRVLLYSTGNYVQSPGIDQDGK